ncbi:hypothetical protein I302_106412 [Kwoniella bestiolae CBS 10118]|uniref:GabA permease n=1 Tax=Kwoniella bestiolae CBS 10118 TaxID=1296100 RepID=A0A1B9G1G9_9TREE|nr:hypothetical protein I302_06330 [Kwoniella bestiolae CBS 10118]OCF24869.1 hypothetical protein I302_06330 [Kwoniella bestiolae CBS 10118]
MSNASSPKALTPAGKMPAANIEVLETGQASPLRGEDIGDNVLHDLGYDSQLNRTRSFSHIFSMTVTCLAVPYGMGAALYTSIIGGGPATIIWGSVFVCFVYWMQAYSLGELAARFPTAAGPYYWTYQTASSRTRVFLSYLTGWIILIGVIIVSLSVAFGLSQHIVATVNITHPDYVAPQWVYILICYALLLVASSLVIFRPDLLPTLDKINFVWTWTYQVVYIVVLLATAKAGRRSAKFAFTHYDSSYSGWGSGWTFFIGLLPSAFANCSIGLVTSMAEEVKDPARNIPRAMTWTMPCSLILSWAYALPLTFTLPDMDVLLEAPGGVVLPYAFKLIVGNDAGAVVMTIGIMGIGFFCLIAINTTASRMLWSFSRDHAVPGSVLWSQTTSKGNIPLAICLSVLLQALLCLIDLGSTLAFNSFVSAAILAFNIGYAVPVLSNLSSHRHAIKNIQFSWSAQIGRYCNVGMLLWTCLAAVLFSMPVGLPVTAQSMNYAAVVLSGFVAITVVWYGVYARKVYRGPPHVASQVEHEM